jgi:hypothetical protein
VTVEGHEERFQPPSLSGRCRLGEATFAETRGEQLVSQLRELEAPERVLARYTKGSQGRRTSSAKMPAKGNDRGGSSATTRAQAHYDRNT